MPTLQRMQWSRNGITIYDAEHGFITRIENARHVSFMNQVIIAALKRIASGDTGMEDDDGQIIVRRQHEDAESTSSEEIQEAVAPI